MGEDPYVRVGDRYDLFPPLKTWQSPYGAGTVSAPGALGS
jgi:hypothetical protein